MIDLTPRQTQIRDLIIAGWRMKEIARQLGISPRTVESLGQTVRQKYGARNYVHLAYLVCKGAEE